MESDLKEVVLKISSTGTDNTQYGNPPMKLNN